MEIKVVGSGCATCKKLLTMVQEAVKDNPDIKVLYITDMGEIMKTGLMHMPGLIINGRVKSSGRVPSINEIKRMIAEEK